tara:strand:+ start:22340 stop:22591 length:252 start_codon:yes stop_codon:yes gene_type:complete
MKQKDKEGRDKEYLKYFRICVSCQALTILSMMFLFSGIINYIFWNVDQWLLIGSGLFTNVFFYLAVNYDKKCKEWAKNEFEDN